MFTNVVDLIEILEQIFVIFVSYIILNIFRKIVQIYKWSSLHKKSLLKKVFVMLTHAVDIILKFWSQFTHSCKLYLFD